MRCPICGAEMTEGAYEVHSSFGRFLFAGISWDALWFRRDGGARRDKQLVVDHGEPKSGWRCDSCKASVLVGDVAPGASTEQALQPDASWFGR